MKAVVTLVLNLFYQSLLFSSSSSICSNIRRSSDAIVVIVQNKHATHYGKQKNILSVLFSSMKTHYKYLHACDILVWHADFLVTGDILDLQWTNVRLCSLIQSEGWGVLQSRDSQVEAMTERSYVHRFFAVTCWDVMQSMGYEWMMKVEHESVFLSEIRYNIFDYMRSMNMLFGFRLHTIECGGQCDSKFSSFVTDYMQLNNATPAHTTIDVHDYNAGEGSRGFDNSFFVTNISWWKSLELQRFVKAYEASGFISTHHHTDLIFHSMAVKLFASPARVMHFADWTYQHHGMRNGKVVNGGIVMGVGDVNWPTTRDTYLSTFDSKHMTCKSCFSIDNMCELLHPATKEFMTLTKRNCSRFEIIQIGHENNFCMHEKEELCIASRTTSNHSLAGTASVSPTTQNALFANFTRHSICTGQRLSVDAIIVLAQKMHSSYDSSHQTTLSILFASLQSHYRPFLKDVDFLVWHEGDMTLADIPDLQPANVRLCDLPQSGGWGKPQSMTSDYPYMKAWSPGYRNMIRFYSVTCWDVMHSLGYEWMMRFDDDSVIHSTVRYNMFDHMRSLSMVYGFRMYSPECGSDEFGPFVTKYMQANNITPLYPHINTENYCRGEGSSGFYNNFYVTNISWWRSALVRHFVQAFDDSHLIFTHRDNDLIFQTAAVKLFASPLQVLHFADWTYQHHTVRNGKVVFGGIQFGIGDENWRDTRTSYENVYDHGGMRNNRCRPVDSMCMTMHNTSKQFLASRDVDCGNYTYEVMQHAVKDEKYCFDGFESTERRHVIADELSLIRSSSSQKMYFVVNGTKRIVPNVKTAEILHRQFQASSGHPEGAYGLTEDELLMLPLGPPMDDSIRFST